MHWYRRAYARSGEELQLAASPFADALADVWYGDRIPSTLSDERQAGCSGRTQPWLGVPKHVPNWANLTGWTPTGPRLRGLSAGREDERVARRVAALLRDLREPEPGQHCDV